MGLVGNTNEEKIWNFLKMEGLNECGIAGLMGNLYAESGLDPQNLQDSYENPLGFSDLSYTTSVDRGHYGNFVKDRAGYGLAQWTYWSRKQKLLNHAKSCGKSIGDLEMQLSFLVKELKESYPSVMTSLKTATTVLEASNTVLMKYENPTDQSVAVQNKRASLGQGYYRKYVKNKVNGGNTNMSVCSYTKGLSTKLTTNFVTKEFDCNGYGCCSQTLHDPKLSEYLQKIRTHFGKELIITSGYRCPTYNARPDVGGSNDSFHTKGMAADFYIEGVAPIEIAKYAESIGVLGIGLYSNFVHIDTRTTKYFWYGHEQSPRTTFGGTSVSTSTSSAVTSTATGSSASYAVGKTYKTQVGLAVRSGAGTNYARKTYSQLTLNARKNATSAGYLKAGVTVTCLEVKNVGSDIWIRIPSGWCAAYYNGKYYIN